MDNNHLSADSLLKPAEDIVSRIIAGEMILVPIRRSAVDFGSIFTLNDTGARIWTLLDGRRTLGQVRDTIVAEHEVDAEQAWTDLVKLVNELLRVGAVLEA